ncbi:hypothetical protein ABW21_db0208034 [Orbilia brochopaga]|nr:hypothetical protein ABW21_db0208034 [Drechslerella brochopaga]
MAIDNIWGDKIDYLLSTPSKAVVFGSHIPFFVKIVSLSKGLRPSGMSVALKETYEVNGVRSVHSSRTILEKEYPGWADTPAEEITGSWIWNEVIKLPRTLSQCLQDCEAGNVKIRHKLRFAIQLANADNHISELRANLPVMLFISPNYMVNEENEVPAITSNVTAEGEISCPPRYENHLYDALFDGIDLDMYLSQTNSPVLSRAASTDNLYQSQAAAAAVAAAALAPLTPLYSGSGTASPFSSQDIPTSRSSEASSGPVSGIPSLLTPHGHADLVDRLQRASLLPPGSTGSLNALANSTSWTGASSGRQSPTGEHADNEGTRPSSSGSSLARMDMETMNQVPSYTTATKTPPVRNLSFEAPPTYERVASNPPSRVTSSQSLLEMGIMRPRQSRASSSSGESAVGSSALAPLTPIHPPLNREASETTASETTVSDAATSSSGRTPKLFSPRWRG